jgi:hypothetical protein
MPKEVRVHQDHVYYPEGDAEQDLYVNRKISKRTWRTSPRRVASQVDLTAPRICGRQCVGTSKSTGQRCRRRTCMDYRYCPIHLAAVKHLLIAKSKRLHDLGVDGMGLYAYDPEIGRLQKDAHGFPVPDKTRRVFAKKSEIGDYGGERLSRAEFDARYEDPENRETGSYAEGGTNFILDGLAAASAVSYSNESLDVAALMRSAHTYREFKAAYDRRSSRDGKANVQTKQRANMIRMVATKPIYQGDEILWHYGPGYWGTPGMKSFITGSAW